MMTAERAPFTKPLTGAERRELLTAINEELRQRGNHIRKQNGTQHLDWENEVREAIEAFENMTPKMLANLNQEVAA